MNKIKPEPKPFFNSLFYAFAIGLLLLMLSVIIFWIYCLVRLWLGAPDELLFGFIDFHLLLIMAIPILGGLGYSSIRLLLAMAGVEADFLKTESELQSETLSELRRLNRSAEPLPPKTSTVVKIYCRSCKSLNDADARFCKKCGKEL